MSFVYIKLSITKTLCIYELLAMVIVFLELSKQNICIYVVGNAKGICKLFSKKKCLYELLAMSFVYIKLSITKTLCIYELLAMVTVFVDWSTQKICICVVGNAKSICKLFSKKIVYLNCWQWLLYISKYQ